jgi:hypothetical protein
MYLLEFIPEALRAPNISTLSVQMYLLKFIPEALRAPNISTLSVQMYLLKLWVMVDIRANSNDKYNY